MMINSEGLAAMLSPADESLSWMAIKPNLGSSYPFLEGKEASGTHPVCADARLRICRQTRAKQLARIRWSQSVAEQSPWSGAHPDVEDL
jgi:hypothetical protein